MRPELRRRMNRLIWLDRLRRGLGVAVPVSLGAGIVGGGMWMRTHGGPTWLVLPFVALVALGKPAFLLVRFLNRNKTRSDED